MHGGNISGIISNGLVIIGFVIMWTGPWSSYYEHLNWYKLEMRSNDIGHEEFHEGTASSA